MTARDWIDLTTNLAWPLIAFLAVVYVWRSDAIGKLIKVSDAIKDLRERLKDLVEVEERLRQSTGAIGDVTATINQIQVEFLSMKADIENIRDNVDQRHESPDTPPAKAIAKGKLDALFTDINGAWQSLNSALEGQFGWFDGRKTGSEAYRFAHGNRKGARLTYEQAAEIARLHSSIKSYRRRQASLADWLTQGIRDEFVNACSAMTNQVRDSQFA